MLIFYLNNAILNNRLSHCNIFHFFNDLISIWRFAIYTHTYQLQTVLDFACLYFKVSKISISIYILMAHPVKYSH